jgi:putative transcriptional regulator
MHRKADYENLSFFEQVKLGLEQSIAHSRGELSLRTTTLPLPPPPASPRRVAALRRRLKMSQSVFAAALNVSPKLVQSWEQGIGRPSRGDLRLIQIIEKQPQLIDELLAPLKATEPASRPRAPKNARTRRTRAVA